MLCPVHVLLLEFEALYLQIDVCFALAECFNIPTGCIEWQAVNAERGKALSCYVQCHQLVIK